MSDCFEAVYVEDGATYYCKAELTTQGWLAWTRKSPLGEEQDPPIGASSLEDAKKQAHDALAYKLGLESTTTLTLVWKSCPE